MSYSKKFNLTQEVISNYSSSDEEVTPKSYKKIQTIWKDLRQTKNLTEALKSMKVQETKMIPENNISGSKETIDKLARTEKLLNDAQDEIILLKKKLKDAENEIERCHTKIAKQLNMNALQSNQLDEFMTKYEDLSIVYKEHIERSKESHHILDRELEEKNRELEKLKIVCKERLDKFSSTQLCFEQAKNKVNRLEDELNEKNEELVELKRRSAENETLYQELKKTQDNEITALVEVERLRAEVQRLIKLLKSTKEYKNFADFTTENGGTMRFLKDASKRHRTPSTDYSRTTSASLRGHSQKLSLGGRNNEEKNLWVSQEAYNVTLEFIEKNKGNLNESNMDKLLHGLNMIWGKREQETIEKISSQFRSEIATLKRKLSQVSIGGIEGNQANLKQRKNSRDVEKENESPSIRQSHKIPPSVRIIDKNTKTNKSMLYANDENSILKTNSKSNRRKPFEDSFEADNDILRKCEYLKAKIEEILEEFIRKRKEILAIFNGKPEIGVIIRKEDWLLESVETIVEEFSKGVDRIKYKKQLKSTSSAALNYTIL